MNILNKIIIINIALLGFILPVHAGGIINGNQTAYIDNPELISLGAENINFAATYANPVPDLSISSGLTGRVWSSALGWIQFSGTNYGVNISCNSSTQTGVLSGFAWGSSAGWINFSPTNGGVSVDTEGVLEGSAWIQNAGWMVFDKSVGLGNPGYIQFDFKCEGNSSSENNNPQSIKYICKDPDAINYTNSQFARHKSSLCEYDTTTKENILIQEENDQACNVPFSTYHKKGSYNPEIKRIQNFLNQNLNQSLVLDGINGGNTTQAIKDFQEKYRIEILEPWNLSKATGYWYQSTRYQANKILGCPETPLTLDNGYFLDY